MLRYFGLRRPTHERTDERHGTLWPHRGFACRGRVDQPCHHKRVVLDPGMALAQPRAGTGAGDGVCPQHRSSDAQPCATRPSAKPHPRSRRHPARRRLPPLHARRLC